MNDSFLGRAVLTLSSVCFLSLIVAQAQDQSQPPAQADKTKAAPAPLEATTAEEPQEQTSEPGVANLPPGVRPRKPSRLDPINAMLRDGRWNEAAKIFKALKPSDIEPNDVVRYYQLAARTALRTGDRAWLIQLNKSSDLIDAGNDLLILSAMRFLLAGEFGEARSSLRQVKQPELLREIPRRRYLQLWARLEQLEGNRQAEMQWVDKLVGFVSRWDSPDCQACHANPKAFGDQVTTLNLKNWWVGERYSALLQERGDATVVQAQALKRLTAFPHDTEARIRLAYALRALKSPVSAERELRTIAWTEWPDREVRKPMRFVTFP